MQHASSLARLTSAHATAPDRELTSDHLVAPDDGRGALARARVDCLALAAGGGQADADVILGRIGAIRRWLRRRGDLLTADFLDAALESDDSHPVVILARQHAAHLWGAMSGPASAADVGADPGADPIARGDVAWLGESDLLVARVCRIKRWLRDRGDLTRARFVDFALERLDDGHPVVRAARAHAAHLWAQMPEAAREGG